MDKSVFESTPAKPGSTKPEAVQSNTVDTAMVAQGVVEVQLEKISATLQDVAAQNEMIADELAPQVQNFLQNDLSNQILSRLDMEAATTGPKPLEVVDMSRVSNLFPKSKTTAGLRLPQSRSQLLLSQSADS